MVRRFGPDQIARLEPISALAEDVTATVLREAEFGSPRFAYDIATLRDGDARRSTRRALAQVAKLVTSPLALPRRVSPRYRIELNDHRILKRVAADGDAISLDALLLYVLTHELVHIVRFATFARGFYLHRADRRTEERVVHGIAIDALSRTRLAESVAGLRGVLERFSTFR